MKKAHDKRTIDTEVDEYTLTRNSPLRVPYWQRKELPSSCFINLKFVFSVSKRVKIVRTLIWFATQTDSPKPPPGGGLQHSLRSVWLPPRLRAGRYHGSLLTPKPANKYSHFRRIL